MNCNRSYQRTITRNYQLHYFFHSHGVRKVVGHLNTFLASACGYADTRTHIHIFGATQWPLSLTLRFSSIGRKILLAQRMTSSLLTKASFSVTCLASQGATRWVLSPMIYLVESCIISFIILVGSMSTTTDFDGWDLVPQTCRKASYCCYVVVATIAIVIVVCQTPVYNHSNHQYHSMSLSPVWNRSIIQYHLFKSLLMFINSDWQ